MQINGSCDLWNHPPNLPEAELTRDQASGEGV